MTSRGVLAAIALTTAAVGRVDVDQAEVVGDVDLAEVVAAFTEISSRLLTTLTVPGVTEHVLQVAALAAARFDAIGGGPA